MREPPDHVQGVGVLMAMSFAIDWADMLKLNGMLQRVEKVPQKCVTRAASKGATIVRKAVRVNAPVLTGDLKRGIVRKAEHSRAKGKKVYDLMFDPGMNDVFQKPIKNPGEAGGKNPKAYYPASMEYGYLTRSKGGGYDYVPGYHFMRDATEEAAPSAKRTVIRTMTQELEKEWLR